MKLPEKIIGRNRLRDAGIVLYFKRDALTYEELAEKFGLTERRIMQILSKNHAFVKVDKEWERQKRIARIKRRIKELEPEPLKNKDELDVIRELREELEEKDNTKSSSETRVIIIRDSAPLQPTEGRKQILDEKTDNANQDQGRTVSGQVSVFRV